MKKYFLLIVGILLLFHGTSYAIPVQWSGNGHWYDVITLDSPITWEDARDAADATGGHLATITSSAEDAFVWNLVSGLVFDAYWLGGYQTSFNSEPDGGWEWITGETWSYTNWYPSEPNNGVGGTQHYLHYWPEEGFWDDMENRNTMIGYVTEYAPVPEPTTILLLGAGLIGLAGAARRKKRN